MTLNIRAASDTDEAHCLDMIETLTGETRNSGWSATFEVLLSGRRGEMLVADEEGALLGVLTVSYNLAIRYGGEYAQLEDLIVAPAARGKNIGGLLVEAAVERARDRGCVEFGVYLVEATEHNRPFYKKYGFDYVGSELRRRLQELA